MHSNSQVITKEVPYEVEKIEYREVQVPVDKVVDKVVTQYTTSLTWACTSRAHMSTFAQASFFAIRTAFALAYPEKNLIVQIVDVPHEKVVFQDRIVYQDKIVYNDKHVEVPAYP